MSTEIEHLLIERPDRLTLQRFDELLTRTPAPWQIRGVLRTQSVSLLYGRRGCFKSFLALDLAASLATGLTWQGHEVVESGLVVYVAGEGGGGMVQRARAWVEQHTVNPKTVNLRFITEPVVVTASSDDMEILVYRIREAIHWQPAGAEDPDTGEVFDRPLAWEWPALIVIDTLARCFTGDENKQEAMGQFIQGVDRLKREFNCSVLIIHHTGTNETRERGSTVLGGACDTMYRLEADTDEHVLTLTNEKMKDSREPEPVNLTYRQVTVQRRPTDDPDEALTSISIERGDMDAEEKIEHMLTVLEMTGGLSWTEWFGATGLTKTTFKRYTVDLVKSGQITKENGKWRVS